MQKTASKSVKSFLSYSCLIGPTRGENLLNPVCLAVIELAFFAPDQSVFLDKFEITRR
jgi:hypothetical protein